MFLVVGVNRLPLPVVMSGRGGVFKNPRPPTPAPGYLTKGHQMIRTLPRGTALALLVASAVSLTACGGETSASGSTATTSASSSSTTPASGGTGEALTMAAVATHNSTDSCWAVISGAVYDLTSWIANHPGGPDKITALCGTDATAAFTGKHGDPGAGGRPQTRLKSFELGPLAS